MAALDGRVAVITGSGAGVGVACAERLGRVGARLILVDWHRDDLGDAVKGLTAQGLEVVPLLGDCSRPDVAEHAAQMAADMFGRVDILINCAGIDLPTARAVTETTYEEWTRTLSANLTSVFVMCRAVLPGMLHKGGVVVNMASTAGVVGVPKEAAYSASKGGVISLTRQMANDFAPLIRVNAVCPGMIERPMRDRRAALTSDEVKVRTEGAMSRPLGRAATYREISDAVFYLVSDEAGFITGSCLVIDGGWTAV